MLLCRCLLRSLWLRSRRVSSTRFRRAMSWCSNPAHNRSQKSAAINRRNLFERVCKSSRRRHGSSRSANRTLRENLPRQLRCRARFVSAHLDSQEASIGPSCPQNRTARRERLRLGKLSAMIPLLRWPIGAREIFLAGPGVNWAAQLPGCSLGLGREPPKISEHGRDECLPAWVLRGRVAAKRLRR
jgi:hypothetical protein